ncbi:hypothetical protein ACSBM8_16870 [Sphingomonas sp. ASY06-1R]|uniref:hypothetical protein n=1 Tax=Sphingomonas sp. ASY06-1R TaxID=3445771 RepID=UPI003FA1B363
MFPKTIRRVAVALVAAATVVPAVTYSQHRATYIESARIGRPADASERMNDRRETDAGLRHPARREAAVARRCNHSSGGTLLGAIAGGLLGNAAVGHRGNNSAGIWAGGDGRVPVDNEAERDC